jgi:hypothetical protein
MSYAPVGSLCCIDGDTAVFLSPAGVELHRQSYSGIDPAFRGGAGQIPTTGEIIVSGGLGTGARIDFFTSQLVPVTTASPGLSSSRFTGGFATSSAYYAMTSAGIRKYNPDGSVAATYGNAGTVTNYRQIAANDADTAAYLGGLVSSTSVVAEIPLPAATYNPIIDRSGTFDNLTIDPGNILVLTDGTIIVSWQDGLDSHEFVEAYDSAGSVLWTVSLGPVPDFTIAQARGADPSYFWLVLSDDSAGLAIFYKRRTSDGGVISSFTKSWTDGSMSYDNMAFFELLVAFGTPPGPTPPSTPTPVFVNSNPACSKSTAPPQNVPGDIEPFGPGWTPQCAGLGAVPTASDLSLTESWDY